MTDLDTTERDHTRSHPDHEHGHDHDHPYEAGAPPAGGPVVVDIGGDVGALMVYVDSARIGQELHVRRPDESFTTHTGIWERRIGSRAVVVAVFPALLEGAYAILDRAGQAVLHVVVNGGQVTELTI